MTLRFHLDRPAPDRTSFPFGCLVALALFPFFAATPAHAAGPMIAHTATGWHVALGYPGDKIVLPDGEYVRNQVQILKVESADARIAGRRTLLTSAHRKADGTADLAGTWTGEPGTWAADVFTPSGGLWDGSWSGARLADGRLTLTFSARGTGGSIDGLDLKETATRSAGAEQDPALPLAITGKTAPPDRWYTALFEDDFQDGTVDPAWHLTPGWPVNLLHGKPSTTERDGALTFRIDPLNANGVEWMNASLSVARMVTLEVGQTAELRLDVEGLGRSEGVLLMPMLYFTARGDTIQDDELWLSKDGLTILKRWGWGESVAGGKMVIADGLHPGVTAILAVTRSNSTNMLLHGKIIDRSKGGAVIYDDTWLDTPARDPSKNEYGPDIVGGHPRTFVEAGFSLGFYPEGLADPPTDLWVSIDDFSFCVYEASPNALQIEHAVLLTPPASGQPYVVEGAPTINGPWTILSAPAAEVHGVKHLIVPISDAPGIQVYRIK